MKKPVYAVLAAALLAGYFCASCSNPWMEKILDPLFNDNLPSNDNPSSNVPVYAIGDTGPGGGTVFYYDPAGFTLYDIIPANNTICHYLEAAPANMSGTLVWGPTGVVANIEDGIGAGRKNTDLILGTHGMSAPAAYACVTYGFPGDWFLPSIGELDELYFNRAVIGNLGTNEYWSSSQYISTPSVFATTVRFSDGVSGGNRLKSESHSVRAIRAF